MPAISPSADGSEGGFERAAQRRRVEKAAKGWSDRSSTGDEPQPPVPDISRQGPRVDAKDVFDGERGPDPREVVDGRRERTRVRRQEHGIKRAGGHAGDHGQSEIGVAARERGK